MSNIHEHETYYEIGEYKLAKTNFGMPSHLDIDINPDIASFTSPQAWSQKIDTILHWYYNFPGAKKEAEKLGVMIPTLDEHLKMFAMVPGDVVEKARILNIPFVGYRNMNTGEFVSQGKRASIWTSSCDGPAMVDSICLQMSCDKAHGNLYGSALGLSVRSFVAEIIRT